MTENKKSGKQLYVVGIGPGAYEEMTIRAAEALKKCDLIVGYTVYVNLIRDHFPDKEFLTTPMTREADRCRLAFEAADEGKSTAMICSGDSGVYGMSGLVLELSGQFPQVEVTIVPGVTAACTGAALLGAPLCHDFAVISLSDLLTPMETIERRLACAAEADFIICLYNPSSKKRSGHLKRACEIVMTKQSPHTVCGVARNIGRPGESMEMMTLSSLCGYEADMFTTVYIGNSQTKAEQGRMVTPRGYKNV